MKRRDFQFPDLKHTLGPHPTAPVPLKGGMNPGQKPSACFLALALLGVLSSCPEGEATLLDVCNSCLSHLNIYFKVVFFFKLLVSIFACVYMYRSKGNFQEWLPSLLHGGPGIVPMPSGFGGKAHLQGSYFVLF